MSFSFRRCTLSGGSDRCVMASLKTILTFQGRSVLYALIARYFQRMDLAHMDHSISQEIKNAINHLSFNQLNLLLQDDPSYPILFKYITHNSYNLPTIYPCH